MGFFFSLQLYRSHIRIPLHSVFLCSMALEAGPGLSRVYLAYGFSRPKGGIGSQFTPSN